MSEKNTDRYMQNIYEEVFNHEYHTETNPMFNGLIPDGWDIIDDLLIIIENKKLIKDKTKGRDQLFNYYDNIKDNHYQTYLILGIGNNTKSFRYIIYDSNKQETKLSLSDIYSMTTINPIFNEQEIRNLNQYLYDNSINLSKSQKTLFIASVLICLKINENILNDFNDSCDSYLIADKMLEIINGYYSDSLFTNNFSFIKKSIHNKHLYHIFNTIKFDIKKYGKDILNQFYSEFCIWDRNNDGKLGIVLTPDDIVNIMVNESFKCYYQLHNKDDKDNIRMIDFCTGTGSFLIKGSNYTKALYGCECGDERYSLAKCNFILNDLDYSNLKYNSCFNEPYESNYFDISIINPPFSNKCKDELNPNNTTNWKSYTKEQRFIMYQLELLKIGGIGCCIVPRSNFNNNVSSVNKFKFEFMKQVKILEYIKCNNKVFMPNANVECVIIIYQKINRLDDPLISNIKFVDYSNDGYKLKKNIRIKYSEPQIITKYKELKWDCDFNECIEDNNYPDIKKLLKLNELDKFYSNIKETLNSDLILKLNDKFNEIDNLEIKEWKTFKIGDVLKYIPQHDIINKSNSNPGSYPLIGGSNTNNGITGYVDRFNYDGDYFTISRSGSTGYCFYHQGKIATNDVIKVFEIKEHIINPNLLALIITDKLSHKYSYSNGLTTNKILSEIINIPIFKI